MARISIGVDKEMWDKQFVVLPPGDYSLICQKAEVGTSSKKGSPQIALAYRIEAPSTVRVDGKEVDVTKQQVFDQVSLQPRAAGFLRQSLVGHGIQFSIDPGTNTVDFDPVDYLQKRVVASIGVETDPNSGKSRNNISKVRPA